MPPLLMLSADIALVVYLFRRDAKSPGRISGVNWVFAIWFMLMGSRTIVDWLWPGANSDIVTGTESNPFNILSGLAFALIGLYVISRRGIDATEIARLNAPLFLLLGYALLSCLWSQEPIVSLRRWIRLVLEIIVIVAAISERDRLMAVTKLLERYAVFALPLSIVLIKYFPDMAVRWDSTGNSAMWTGVTLHKNSLGVGLAASILYFVWKWVVRRDFTRWKTDLLLCFLACYIMFNPEAKGSSTSILSLIPAVAVVLLLGWRRHRPTSIRPFFYLTILAVLILNLGAKALFGGGLLELVTQLSGRDMTFTGRTYIWQAVREEAGKNPIFGTGYGAFWIGSRLDRLHARYLVNDIYQAHNGFLEIYANLGIIGLLLLIMFLITSFDRAIRSLHHDYSLNSLTVSYTVLFMLAEFFEASALTSNSFRWIILLLLLIRMPEESLAPHLAVAPALSSGARTDTCESSHNPARQPIPPCLTGSRARSPAGVGYHGNGDA